MLISFKYPPGDLQTNLGQNKELQRSNVNIMLNPRRPLLNNVIKCTEIYIFQVQMGAAQPPPWKEKKMKNLLKKLGNL